MNINFIIGGVIGFWGGVFLLGVVFMMALMAQKYCCDTGKIGQVQD